ncbi:hypothetical protein ACVW19_005596 [Streptomyces sp. TE5632]
MTGPASDHHAGFGDSGNAGGGPVYTSETRIPCA